MAQEVIEITEREIEVIEVVERGPQGIQGIQGIQGPSGASSWNEISGKPSTFPPSSHTHPISEVVNLQGSLDLKANLDSPALTGTPTAPTASAGTNTTQVATTAFALANRGDRYLTTSTTSHSLTTGVKTFAVQSGLSYTATQDITIVADADPVNKHMHGVVTSYSGTTLVVDIQTVNQSGGPYTAWTINVGGLLSSEGALYSANNLSDVANTSTALTNLGGVPTSRSISAGTGLTGGGDLTANRTLSVSFGTTTGTVAAGDDSRITGAAQKSANLSDLASASTARTNLGLGTAATAATGDFAAASHNHAASAITSGVLDNARINFAAPSAIGALIPNTGLFTNLSVTSRLNLPSSGSNANDIWVSSGQVRYQAGSLVTSARTLLSAEDNLSNLDNTATARTNIGLGSANDVTFGSIQNTPIGSTTRNSGAFTTLNAINGTITASAPVLSLSQTWNNAATTFTGLQFDVTNTASATSSLVARFTVGSTNVFEVDGRGFTTLRKVATSTDFVDIFTVRRGTTKVFGVRDDGATQAAGFSCSAGGDGASNMNSNGFGVRSSGSYSISSDGAAFNPDVFLRRDAAGVFAQYNATNPQAYRIYNTWTDASNYERGFLRWSSNVLQIGTEKLGTGSARALEFQTDGTSRWSISTVGHLLPSATNTYDIGASAGNRPRNVFASGYMLSNSGFYFGAAGAAVGLEGTPASGIMRLYADAGFTRLQFGGTEATFPALKRSSATLQVRLADDSAFAPLECAGLTLNGNLTASTRNIVTDTTTGTRIGTGTTQLLGFWNATPAAQPAAVADATDAASTQARLNDLLARLRTIGIIAT